MRRALLLTLSLMSYVSIAGAARAHEVCGVVQTGTVWTVQNSPVRVTCDLVVEGLRIEAGVQVELMGNYEIVIDGYLLSQGMPGAPVTFAPGAGVAGWKGLYFEDAPAGSALQWTEIEGATSSGVHLVRSAPTFDFVTFRDNSAVNGGGLYVNPLDQDLTLNQCSFLGNYADTAGGGVYVAGPAGPGDAALFVTGCTFSNNNAGTTGTTHNTRAGALYVDGNAHVLRSSFLGNEARAYTIYAYGGRYTQGGAIFSRNGRVEATACVFLKNGCRMGAHSQTPDASRAYGGALYQASDELLLVNCLVARNFLTVAKNPVLRGSGLHSAGGLASVVNTTMTRNSHHAIYANGASVALTNAILFDSNGSGSQIWDASGTVRATYSAIQHGFEGLGNISKNPVFDAYFRIVSPSPAIDAGNPDASFYDVFPPGLGSKWNDMGYTGGMPGGHWNTQICHRDADGDGFGDPHVFALMEVCVAGFVPNGDDCDDGDPAVYPGQGCPDPSGGECGLIADAVWTLGDSPVRVSCDLEIASLIVEAGVEVQVEGDFDIVVNGVLRCLGTAEQPVVFRPAPDNTVGWRGLFLRDTIAGSELRWTEIEGATSSAVHLVRSTPTLDDVTFRGNSAAYGGGVRAEIRDEDLVLNNCSFLANYADTSGGGVHVVGPAGADDAALIVNECTFLDNRAGTTSTTHNTRAGGIYVDGNAQILRSSFVGNEARAYTIYAYGGRYTQGGALFTRNGRVEVTQGAFLKNGCRMGAHSQTPDASRAYGGAIFQASGELHLSDALLARNFLTVAKNPDLKGAGLHAAGGLTPIVHSTLAKNSHHAIYAKNGSVDIGHAVVYDNNGGGTQIWDASSSVSATYSDIQNGFPGLGNIAVNPQFVDAADDDYRVNWGSPCIDAGDPASAPGGPDLDGFPRPLDGDLDLAHVVDMGAFEFAPLRQHGSAQVGDAIELELWGPNGSSAEILYSRGLPLPIPESTPIGELWLPRPSTHSLGRAPVAAGPPFVFSVPLTVDRPLAGQVISFQSVTFTGGTPTEALSNPVVVKVN